MVKNNAVIPEELPETNSKQMNEIYLLYKEYADSIITAYFTQILGIAQQCPFAGGPPVIQARVFIDMVNDSVEYNDDAVCLQSGIYREIMQKALTASPAFDFRLIPNPASQMVTVELNFMNEDAVHFEIRNVLGGIINEFAIDKGFKSISFSVHNFDEGIYFIRVRKDKLTLNAKKLIIIK